MAPSTPRKLCTNKYGFRAQSQRSPVNSPAATPQRKPGATPVRKPPKPNRTKQRKTSALLANRSKRKTPKDKPEFNLQEGDELNPIHIEDDLRIKVEPDLDIKSEELTSDSPHSPILVESHTPQRLHCIPALSNPGTPRGYASMTRDQRKQHDFREFDGARERGRKPVPKPAIRNTTVSHEAKDDEDEEPAKSDNESCIEQDKHAYDCAEEHDQATRHRRSLSRTLSVQPASPLQSSRQRLFHATFRSMVFLECEEVGRVVASINTWLRGRHLPFSQAEARAAFGPLEAAGEVRLYAGKVYVPEGYGALEKEMLVGGE